MNHNGLLSESVSRRSAILGGAVALVGGALAREALGQAHEHGHAATNAAATDSAATERRPPATSASPEAAGGERQTGDVLPPGEPGRDYTPVVVPNGATLPWKIVDGWKVYHLVVEEFEHEFAPGLTATCWGYNGHTPGPLIEGVEGDRVRIYVTNKLPAPTSVHWHGILLPNGMDGVSGLNQKPAEPGETIKYEFVLRQHGTHMYHSHHDEMTQQALGLTGLFVIHPRTRPDQRVDRDFAILLGEWRIDPGTHRPDPLEMSDFNILTMNGKAFPGTDALVIRQARASASATSVRWTTTRSTCMDTASHTLKTTANGCPNRPGGRGTPCSCRSVARGRSSLSPTRLVTGRCTATCRIT
jgi:FtsP/CotA-like multicopper oxidase with cupredoxin domain